MKSVDLLHKFVQIVPEFEKHWEAERKYNCEPDGHFTLHALCSELSQCFREHYRVLTEVQLAELFEFIELNLVEPGAEETKLDNALCTCFLENISSEPCGQFAKTLMGRKTRAFFDQWHSGPPY